MVVEYWQRCSERLKEELPPQQFGTWIRPLRAELEHTNLRLYAPNKFILDWVKNKYLARISDLLEEHISRAFSSELALTDSARGCLPKAADWCSSDVAQRVERSCRPENPTLNSIQV